MKEQTDSMKGQAKKEKKRSHKEGWVIKRPFLTSCLLVISVLLLAYAVLFILTLIDQTTAHVWPNAFTRLEGGVDEWFAFYTSFISIGVSIVLGVITHRLSVKIDRMEKFSKIRGITTEWIRLYDLWRDFKPSVVQYNNVSRRFVLEIKLNHFPPSYSAEIVSVKWGFLNKEYEEEKEVAMEHFGQYIEYGENRIIHLYFDDFLPVDEITTEEDKELSFHYYFRQSCYNPIVMYPYQRQRCLKICMKMQEPLANKKSEVIIGEMCIFVENDGYNEEGYIDLIQKKYTVKIK